MVDRFTIPLFNVLESVLTDCEVNIYSRPIDFFTGVASVNWFDSNGSYQRRLIDSRADDAVVLSTSGNGNERITCTIKYAHQPQKRSGGWNPGKMVPEGQKIIWLLLKINGKHINATSNGDDPGKLLRLYEKIHGEIFYKI